MSTLWRVRYFCPCRETERPKIPLLLENKFCHFTLEELYFCDRCNAARCPKCVLHKPVCIYCPQCLAEFTAEQAVASNNKCTRNCLQCPCCQSNIQVLKTENGYDLSCALCNWSSRNWKRDERITQQVVRARRSKQFEYLQELFARQPASVSDPVPAKLGDEGSSTRFLHGLQERTNVEIEKNVPELVTLRAKYMKSCKECGNVLVKPNHSPKSAKFDRLSTAVETLPEVRARERSTTSLILHFRNVLPCHTHVYIAARDRNIVLMQTDLHLEPAPELEDEATLVMENPDSVKRESETSRRVFMNKELARHCGQISLEKFVSPFYLLITTRFEADGDFVELARWVCIEKLLT